MFVTYAACSMWNKRNCHHANSRQNRVSYYGFLTTKPRIVRENKKNSFITVGPLLMEIIFPSEMVTELLQAPERQTAETDYFK